jgi:hypothetical protein
VHKHTKRFAALLSALFAIAAVGPVTAVAATHNQKHAHHRVVKTSAAETEPATGESTSESAPESAPSDGAGGHEDPAGAETDHQFEGVE